MTTKATFSMPESSIDDIDRLRRKFGRHGMLLNRSEIIRAGLSALEAVSESQALKIASNLERLPPGRPRLK